MTVFTRSGGGGWSSIASPDYYGSVVSNYSAALKQAQESQANVELENAILDYKNGNASYTQVKDLIAARQARAIPGSQKELDLKELALSLNDYETSKQRQIKRANLEIKYAKGGISAAERSLIEQELLSTFKEGTEDYTTQLSIIAQAKELERVESNNAQLARLEARLSEEGISTDEKIQLLEQAKGLAEPGSIEQATLDQKVNELKVVQKEEQKQQAIEQRTTELLDEFAEGGLTNEEKLIMNRELQTFFEKGTADYNKLKEQEAGLLGAIEEDRGKGGSGSGFSKDTQNQAELLLAQLDTQRAQLDAALSAGEITQEEYLQGVSQVISGQESVFEGLPGVELESDALTKKYAQIGADRQELQRREKQLGVQSADNLKGLQAGTLIPIVDANGVEQYVPRDINTLAGLTTKAQVAVLDENGNIQYTTDAQGNKVPQLQEVEVLTVSDNGQQTQVIFNPATGTLERTGSTSTPTGNFLVPTGKEFQFVIEQQPEQKESVLGAATTGRPQTDLDRQIQALRDSGKSESNSKKLVKLLNQQKEGRTSATQGSAQDSTGKGLEAETNKDFLKTVGTNTSNLLKISSPVTSVFGKVISNITSPSGLASLKDAGKKFLTSGDNDTGASELFEAITGLKKLGSGKVNIGKYNVPEYGLTEKLGSVVESAKKKLKDLFK